jgi:autotransporter-associated beta strand protein/probable HAF family extracellular repeat protein
MTSAAGREFSNRSRKRFANWRRLRECRHPQYVKRLLLASTSVGVLAALTPTKSQAQDFTALPYLLPLGTSVYSQSSAANQSGTIFAGVSEVGATAPTTGQVAVEWTSNGVVGLGVPSGLTGPHSDATGVSNDGSVIVGYFGYHTFGINETNEAFIWTQPSGIVPLGYLGGGGAVPDSSANAVSADGKIVAGTSTDASGNFQAFRWTQATGMVGLGYLSNLATTPQSAAAGMSVDGSVIVGQGYDAQNKLEAFRWTQAGGMVGLGFLNPTDVLSTALAVSANGLVAVGYSKDSFATEHEQAFRWTQATGMVGIGYLISGGFTRPFAVNADGSVIVGLAGNVTGTQLDAFRWTAATGMQSIGAILSAGPDHLTGWQLQGAFTVSADGTVISGYGINPAGNDQAFVARIPVDAFALLDLAGTDHALGSLLWGGVVTNSGPNAATFTVGADGTNTTFIGTIGDGTSATSLTKVGVGTLTLTGASTYSGATNILAGTLEVDGSIAHSNLTTVANGAALIGTGTVGNLLIQSGGLFAPGAAGVPGTSMTVAGSLAFQSGAFYFVQVNTAASTIANVVTGTATLDGTVVAAFSPGNYMTKTYDILHSAGLIGTFAGLQTIDLPSGFAASLGYTPTDVVLGLQAVVAQEPGLNGNQRNVANALDNFFNSGGALPQNFMTIFGLNGGSLATALSQLSGEAATDSEKGAFDQMTEFLGLMLDPFVDGRGGTAAGALGFAPDRQASFPPDIALAYAGVLKAPPKPAFEQRWSAWGASYGGYNKTSGDPATGTNDVTARTFGFAAGMDYHVSPDTLAGFALASGGTNWGLAQGLGTGRSDAFQAGVYGKTRSGPAYIAAAFAFADNWMTTNRTAPLGDQLTARFNGQSFGGRIEAGYRYAALPTFGIAPYAALQTQNFHTPSYSETDLTGGGFGLTYGAMNATDTRGELGTRFDDRTMLGTMPLTLRARLAWAHDWVSNAALGAVFETLPGASFTVNGATPPKNSALASAGAELHLTPVLSFLTKFDGEFAKASQTYAGTGTLRYVW